MGNRISNNKGMQRGTVLVISMVILLAMTLIGITAMQNTVLEEKMAGNLRDQSIALQAAEAGVREVLDWIEDESKNPAGMPVAKSDGGSKIWRECAADKTVTCGNGSTAVSIKWLETRTDATVEYGAFLDISDPVLDKDDQGNKILAELPRTIIEEYYAPPPEFEEAVKGKGIVHFKSTSIGFGGTAQARSMEQTVVSIPRL